MNNNFKKILSLLTNYPCSMLMNRCFSSKKVLVIPIQDPALGCQQDVCRAVLINDPAVLLSSPTWLRKD